MLPRYLPHIAWRSWSEWLLGSRAPDLDACESFSAALGGGLLPPFAHAFESLRAGLFVWFSDLRSRAGPGAVLMSAQICIAVRHAAERAGLDVEYVDVDRECPTPAAAQYASALRPTTIAVLVAPMYGHIQSNWKPLLEALGRRALVLDLAQGIGLGNRTALLVERADVVAYSFGLGKGLDTGGGLLFSRNALDTASLPMRGRISFAVAPLKAAALHALNAAGLYGAAMRHFDGIEGADASLRRIELAPVDIYGLWLRRLDVFLEEVALARVRAQALAGSRVLMEAVRHSTTCFSPCATHLRQLLRTRAASRRDALIAKLRRAGIDCAAAGEPLPAANADQTFPNAAAFRAETIRLPFLGRLTEQQFQSMITILERAVAADQLH